jgi:hypothetical protein
MALAEALKVPVLALLTLGVLGCSDDDELRVREALASECEGRGGVVFRQGARSYAACNGADGADGGRGERGPQGEPGEEGQQGAQGPAGDAGPSGPQGVAGDAGAAVPGAVLTAQVSCTSTYTSDDAQPVFVSLEYSEYSDGTTWGFCWLEHRNDSVISLARMQGNQCFLVDWTSEISDGSLDGQGQVLRKSITLDTVAESVTEDGGVFVNTLTCQRLDPVTGQPLP